MNHFDRSAEFDKLAELIAEKRFRGRLPNNPEVIVQGMLKTVMKDPPDVPEAILEAAKKDFADCLRQALRDRIKAQDVAESQLPN